MAQDWGAEKQGQLQGAGVVGQREGCGVRSRTGERQEKDSIKCDLERSFRPAATRQTQAKHLLCARPKHSLCAFPSHRPKL